MHVISHKIVKDFYQKHSKAEEPLNRWYGIISKGAFNNFAELKKLFPSADFVDGFIVFNVGGNNYRVITAIHFNTHKCYIRHVLTHEEYNLGKWKKG